MGVKMQIECGTRGVAKFEIDLDDYDTQVKTNVDPVERKKAFDLLRATMNDYNFANDGYRNDDAVNGCIALHVLGYDAETWFENFCAEQCKYRDRWFATDLDRFMEHVERVAKYLSKWGPDDDRGAALGYVLD